jgi:hypothetical protein
MIQAHARLCSPDCAHIPKVLKPLQTRKYPDASPSMGESWNWLSAMFEILLQ